MKLDFLKISIGVSAVVVPGKSTVIDLFCFELMWSVMGKQDKEKCRLRVVSHMHRERKDLNWTKNLRPLPKFTMAKIRNHMETCGKKRCNYYRLNRVKIFP